MLDNDSEAGIIPDMPIINVDKATGEVTGTTENTPAIEAVQEEEFFEAAAVDEELTRRKDAQPEKTQEAVKKQPRAAAASKPKKIDMESMDDGFFGGGEG